MAHLFHVSDVCVADWLARLSLRYLSGLDVATLIGGRAHRASNGSLAETGRTAKLSISALKNGRLCNLILAYHRTRWGL